MITRRGKDFYSRSMLRSLLIATNTDTDGPWEPAVFVKVTMTPRGFGFDLRTTLIGLRHDDKGTLDIHLPGDGKPFDMAPVLAKLLLAEVIEEP